MKTTHNIWKENLEEKMFYLSRHNHDFRYQMTTHNIWKENLEEKMFYLSQHNHDFRYQMIDTFFSLHCIALYLLMELEKLSTMEEKIYGFEVENMGLGE